MNLVKKRELAQNWIDEMRERFDRYKTDRNEFLADVHLPPKEVMFYRDVILPFVENTLIMDNIAASEGIKYDPGGIHNRLQIKVFINNCEIKARYPHLQRLECDSKYSELEKQKCEIIYPDHFPYLIKPIKESVTLNHALNNKDFFSDNNEDRKPVQDVSIALPSEHAFYSILENFIRNGAKHNNSKLRETQQDLVIYISVDDKANDNSIDSEYYTLTLFDNVSSITRATLFSLLKRLNDSLIDDTGKPKRENLGIADMKINCHLLSSSIEITDESLKNVLNIVLFDNLPEGNRCSNCHFSLVNLSEDLLENENKCKKELDELLNGLSAESSNRVSGKEEKKYRFGYRFKLAKAKSVCWIGKTVANAKKEILKTKGIYLFKDVEEFFNHPNKSISLYKFAILESGVLNDWNKKSGKENDGLKNKLEELLLKLPFRVLLNTEIKEKVNGILKQFIEDRRIQVVEEQINLPDCDDDCEYKILKNCWENWLLRWLYTDGKKKKPHLLLHFEEKNDNWNSFEGNDYYKFTKLWNISNVKIDEKKEIAILFGQHGGGLDKIDGSVNWKDHSFQSIGKGSADFTSIFYPPNNDKNKELFCYELIEAGLCRFLILDERLCANMYDTNDENKEIGNNMHSLIFCEKDNNEIKPSYQWHIDATGRLFLVNNFLGKDILSHREMPNTTFNCSINTKNGSVIELDIYYKNYKISDAFDGIIIHRTFLNEEWLSNKIKGNSIEDKQQDFLRMLNNKIPIIILISGGGSPTTIKGFYKFKPFSIYDRLFGHQFAKLQISKYTLT